MADTVEASVRESVFVCESMSMNVAKYESYKVEIGMTTTIKEGETFSAAAARAKALIQAELKNRLDTVCDELGIERRAPSVDVTKKQPRRVKGG